MTSECQAFRSHQGARKMSAECEHPRNLQHRQV